MIFLSEFGQDLGKVTKKWELITKNGAVIHQKTEDGGETTTWNQPSNAGPPNSGYFASDLERWLNPHERNLGFHGGDTTNVIYQRMNIQFAMEKYHIASSEIGNA